MSTQNKKLSYSCSISRGIKVLLFFAFFLLTNQVDSITQSTPYFTKVSTIANMTEKIDRVLTVENGPETAVDDQF